MLVMMMCNTSFVLERAVSASPKSFVPVVGFVGYIFSILEVKMCRPSECSLTCYVLEYCPCGNVCLS